MRQGDRCIHEISGRQREQKGTRLQSNAKPLTVGRTVSKRRGLRLGTPHGQGELAMVSGHDHLRAALGNREKRPSALTMSAPDPFDNRRVRRSVLIKDNHASPSKRCENASQVVSACTRCASTRSGCKHIAHAVFAASPASHDSTNVLVFKREKVFLANLWLIFALLARLCITSPHAASRGVFLRIPLCLSHSLFSFADRWLT